ncbi:hypothetical protein RHSIM_Rhsim12G0193500 [Rhododendron simsii]|uniref:Uncharacterized protein n=1 Tax=Rhododendron simsii TaxID=118357 RepID=A0A834G463_RHOSS|nr:hypothetical protein RHSIM_Rhsim12G0193500 [Rhododendron simsii]
MPKDRRIPSSSTTAGSRPSPYPCGSNNSKQYKSRNLVQPVADEREWEEVRCPICMEHPHNAVLLLCSSHAKGCRPYMCDTSYRHSNCLDQFRKSSSSTASPDLHCPFCRGQIRDWKVVDPARRFMNSKPRSCALETCDYRGTYSELRKHARRDHPFVRPTDVDSGRQSDWMRMDREGDWEDFLSASHSLESEVDVGMRLDSVRDLEDFLSASPLLEPRVDWSDHLGLEFPFDDLSLDADFEDFLSASHDLFSLSEMEWQEFRSEMEWEEFFGAFLGIG